MDFSLQEEQEMLKKMASDFLTDECPKKLARELLEDRLGYSPQVWAKMAQLGWMGLVFPEKYGGGGASFVDLMILLEEMGRASLPSPFFSSVVLGGLSVLQGGSEGDKQTYLRNIISGDSVWTLALTEACGDYKASDIQTKAARHGKDYLIDGVKLFVPYAHVADYVLCAARTNIATPSSEGITLLVVDANTAGIACEVLPTSTWDRQCSVVFDQAKVPQQSILGESDAGWDILTEVLQKATLAKCAEMLGIAQQVLDMTVAYAKERIQFGRPIGSFQAIQHYCANMLADVEASRYITYEAAWRLSTGLECTTETAMAKAWLGEALQRIAVAAHQVHGAIGFCEEHDLPLYSRQAQACMAAFGDGDFHRETVAEAMGL
jgi:alkylation response protein AidB-like acyl-CoA dehydrogenase